MIGAIITAVTTLGGGLLTAWNKSKDVTISSFTAAGAIAASQVQAMALWIGHPLSPPSIMAYGVAIWFFKATACDKVIGPALGYNWTTDPISGETAVIAGLVVSGMFFSGIANILRRS